VPAAPLSPSIDAGTGLKGGARLALSPPRSVTYLQRGRAVEGDQPSRSAQMLSTYFSAVGGLRAEEQARGHA
jgi:hypothetical protein